MSHIKAKMHHIRFPLRLSPRPNWGAHSASPDPPGPTSKRMEGGDGEGSGAGGRNLAHPKILA